MNKQNEQLKKIEEDINLLRYNINVMLQQRQTFVVQADKRNLKFYLKKILQRLLGNQFERQNQYNVSISNAVQDLERITTRLLEMQQDLRYELSEEQKNWRALNEEKRPRVIQLVSVLNFGDAVGNEVIAFKNIMSKAGIPTGIFTAGVHKKIPDGTAWPIDRLPELRDDDIIIYHFASKCALFDLVKTLPGKKVLRYHNVTPPEFFAPYDKVAESVTREGLEQVLELKEYIDYVLAVSEFNKADLIRMGYTCKIDVLPILIKFDDYEQIPSKDVIEKYTDGIKNIVFVGRVAPNKKFEDLIQSFACYQKMYGNQARLILVGSYSEEDKYYLELIKLENELNVKNVIFTGHISFADILAYYKVADVFLCLSEHEGFCVPLVEAMYFNVPIIAYASSAIPDTLGGSGVLLEDKSPAKVSVTLNQILNSRELREQLIVGERKRLNDFDGNLIGNELMKYIKEIQGEIYNVDRANEC